MSQFRLTRKLFDWNYALGNNIWATEKKEPFTNIGMENVFSIKVVRKLNTAGKLLYVKCNNWEEETDQKPKLRNMSHLIEPEPYECSYMSWSTVFISTATNWCIASTRGTGGYNV